MGSSVAAVNIDAEEVAGCAHCGLPTRGDDPFCCYGCELASEIAAEAKQDHAVLRGTLTFGLLLTMSVMMLSLFLYAEDVYGAGAEAGLVWMRTFYRWASAVLATPVMFLCGLPVARRAIAKARSGQLSMSALIAAGAFSAYALSIHSILTGGGATYFDSATAALVLATLGRYLEASARTRASGIVGRGLEGSAEPVEARMDGRPLGRLPHGKIRAGMQLTIAPEQTVPVDVVASQGPVDVDTGVLTGESEPITVSAGDLVPAGAVPISGPLLCVARSEARDSTLARLEDLARGLRDRPSRLLRIADRFARLLTPAVWALALGTFAWWTQARGIETGVVNGLAVVLVACPCTYAIAAPLVHWLAMKRALAGGVLFRTAETLDALAAVDTVGFDKTGTLTSADLTVRRFERLEEAAGQDEILGLVRALEEGSRHPVGHALFRFAAGCRPRPISNRRFLPGRGVEAKDDAGRPLLLGRSDQGIRLVRDGVPLARFELEEDARPEASSALSRLRELSVRSFMVTGDTSARAEAVAQRLGLEYFACLSPEAKVETMKTLGDRTAMVGDGVNDAPALAGAVTGIAMGGGTQLSRGLANVTLLTDDLSLVPWAIELARRANGLVLRLLGVATLYNAVFITLAVTGMLRPVWAGLSMLLSSLITLAVASLAGGEERC